MRAGLLFGKLQGKKYIKMIPVILLESCLFAVLLFLFGSFASKAIYGDLKVREIKVGIVSEEDSAMTRMLVGFVESMDSFQGSCQFSLMEETEAERALEQGEIYAAIYLPAGVLESILNGENLPAKIVFGHAGSQMETAVFREVAGAGNRLLSVAQAGIYAADELCINVGQKELISEAEDALNQAYLDYALNRNAIFKMHEVTATGKVSLIAYYVVALFLIFLSFVGTIMSRKSVIEPSAHSDLLAVSGMGYMRQYVAEALAFSGVFALLGTILGVPVLCLVMKIENWGIPGVIEIVTLLGVLLMLGAFVRLLSEITGKEAGGIGISLFVQFMMIFASGLLLPSAFLPARIEKAGRWMPYHLWMELLLSCVQKNSEGRGVLLLLICFAGCIFTGAVIFRRRKSYIWNQRKR